MPKVSIIIPVYNVERYLNQCLDSVINQTLSDIEIICIDDGSTDKSAEICDAYALKDKRVKVIHQKNRGLGGARNSGLNIANGEYILFVDSDDWIEFATCLTMYNKAIEIDADVVLTGETLYLENTKEFKPGWRNFEDYKDIKEISEINLIETFTPAWGRLYKRDFINKNKLKFVEKCYYEDNSWGCFIFILAKQIGFVKNQFFYRQRDDAITAVKDHKVFDWVRDFQFFHNFIKTKNINPEKLDMAKMWYLLNFYNYYHQLSLKNKKIFRDKIREILPLLKIDTKLIETTKVISSKTERKRLICFFKFLNSKFLYNYYYLHKNCIKGIFSIKNSTDKKHKIITFLGLKFKFKIKNTKYKIPKIIHYCWFGNYPKTQLVEKCIISWKKYLPDYEIREWNDKDLINCQNAYVQEAYKAKKWAFITDYFRLYALYNYGGVYFDSDNEVFKSFNEFLNLDFFSGYENYNGAVSPFTAVVGAVKGNKIIKNLLDEYSNLHFIKENGEYDLYTNTARVTDYFQRIYKFLPPYDENYKKTLENGCIIYPSNIFCKYKKGTSYAVHHFNGSWLDKENANITKEFNIKELLRTLFSVHNKDNHKILCICGIKMKFRRFKNKRRIND